MKDTIKKIAKERNIHIKETEITKEHNTEQIINDNIKIKRLKEAEVKTHISETKIETKENFENQLQNQEKDILIYTDGSALKNPGPCGAGCVILSKDRDIRLAKALNPV